LPDRIAVPRRRGSLGIDRLARACGAASRSGGKPKIAQLLTAQFQSKRIMNEMVSWALVTLPSFGGASSCRLHCPGRCQESAMPSFQIRVAAALLSATISAPIFAQEIQAKVLRQSISSKAIFLGEGRTKIAGYTWCLHNHSADAIDCSYRNRKQCEETAAGGLGECVFNSSSC
jgi:hypothetical protein